VAEKYMELMETEAVRHAQAHYYGKAHPERAAPGPDALTEDEISFIESRDSFYMATVNADGWPYIQHRGGPQGFLHVMDASHLAFADFRGNRQLLTTGNLAGSDKVALFLMDYPNRTRLKILGHARVVDAREHPELVPKLGDSASRAVVERLFFIDVLSYDWNCPQHITQRFTLDQVQAAVVPLKQRIAELETLLEASKKQS